MPCLLKWSRKLFNRVVSQCPAIPMDLLGRKVPSLLDPESMVTLICMRGILLKNILPLLNKSSGELAEAHSMFRLSTGNNEVMPILKYFEADVTLLGFRIPRVGFLVVKDPNVLLEPQHSTQLPGVIRCNLIWLGCKEFWKVIWIQCSWGIPMPSWCSSSSFSHNCVPFTIMKTTG